jgi:hypothetical protein
MYNFFPTKYHGLTYTHSVVSLVSSDVKLNCSIILEIVAVIFSDFVCYEIQRI